MNLDHSELLGFLILIPRIIRIRNYCYHSYQLSHLMVKAGAWPFSVQVIITTILSWLRPPYDR